MPKSITIQKILGVLLHRLPVILLSGIVMAVIFFVYTSVAIKPVYSTSAMIYVQNYGKQEKKTDDTDATVPAATGASQGAKGSESLQSNNDVAQKIFSSDLAGSASLAQSCIILFKNDPLVTNMFSGCNVSMSVPDNSFYITITVSGTDYKKLTTVADNVVTACGEVFTERFPYGKVGKIHDAGKPKMVSPDKVKNTIIGGLIGIVLACVIAVLLELIDTTIKSDDDLSAMYKVPVFAEIPDFENSGR